MAWTSGYAAIRWSENNWVWEYQLGVTQPITYTPWGGGQPDNFLGRRQDYIILKEGGKYFFDVENSFWANDKEHCYVCEQD